MRSALPQSAHTAQSCGCAFAPAFGADVGTAMSLLVIKNPPIFDFSKRRTHGAAENGYRKPIAVRLDFSVSDCSKPAQKAAVVFNCPPDTVEPSVIR